MAASSAPSLLLVIAPLPPPLHGVSATTMSILEYLDERIEARIANVSPGAGKSLADRLLKPRRMIAAAFMVLAHSRRGKRVIYMTADGGGGIIYNILIAIIARVCKYRVILHHHSFAYINRRNRLMMALTHVLGSRGIHVVLCEAMGTGLLGHYPLASSQMVLSNSALLPPSPSPRRVARQELTLGFMSNLIVEKGVDTSIRLLRAGRAAGLSLRLRVAGPFPDQRAAEMIGAAQAEFGASFDYVGPVADDQKAEFFGSLNAFLFPTRYVNEAQPRVVLEALAHGVPVITVARSCMPSDVGEEAGFCISPSDDFVKTSLAILEGWRDAPETLAAMTMAAEARGKALHSASQKQISRLIDMFAAA